MHDTQNVRSAKWGIRADRVNAECASKTGATWPYRVFARNNVLWRSIGMQMKGNRHQIVRNLVLWPGGKDHETGNTGTTQHGGFNVYNELNAGTCMCKSDLCKSSTTDCCVPGDNSTFENRESEVTGNVMGARGGYRGGTAHFPLSQPVDGNIGAPLAKNNSAGDTSAGAELELRDPGNLDFRPKKNSFFARACRGPYDPGLGHGGVYWIAGRQDWRASTPVPVSGGVHKLSGPGAQGTSTADATDPLDLKFLAALGALGHHIVVGIAKQGADVSKKPQMHHIGTLVGEANIFVLAESKKFADVFGGISALRTGGVIHWQANAFFAKRDEQGRSLRGKTLDPTALTAQRIHFSDVWNVTIGPGFVPPATPLRFLCDHYDSRNAATTGPWDGVSSNPIALPDGAKQEVVHQFNITALTSRYVERRLVTNFTLCLNATVEKEIANWNFRINARYGKGYHWGDLTAWIGPRPSTATKIHGACFDDLSSASTLPPSSAPWWAPNKWDLNEPFTALWKPQMPLLSAFLYPIELQGYGRELLGPDSGVWPGEKECPLRGGLPLPVVPLEPTTTTTTTVTSGDGGGSSPGVTASSAASATTQTTAAPIVKPGSVISVALPTGSAGTSTGGDGSRGGNAAGLIPGSSGTSGRSSSGTVASATVSVSVPVPASADGIGGDHRATSMSVDVNPSEVLAQGEGGLVTMANVTGADGSVLGQVPVKVSRDGLGRYRTCFVDMIEP